MKSIVSIMAICISIQAQAISSQTLQSALNSSELKDKLQKVDIIRIQQLEAYKCIACYLVSIQGTKLDESGSHSVDHEIQFLTEGDLSDGSLKVTIKSESK